MKAKITISCAICAWRLDCSLKFRQPPNPTSSINCIHFTRDVTLKCEQNATGPHLSPPNTTDKQPESEIFGEYVFRTPPKRYLTLKNKSIDSTKPDTDS